jgi:hypothetical protein
VERQPRALAQPVRVGQGKEESVISWDWQTHTANQAKLEAAMADPANGHLRFVRLTSPAAVRRFLRGTSPTSGGD